MSLKKHTSQLIERTRDSHTYYRDFYFVQSIPIDTKVKIQDGYYPQFVDEEDVMRQIQENDGCSFIYDGIEYTYTDADSIIDNMVELMDQFDMFHLPDNEGEYRMTCNFNLYYSVEGLVVTDYADGDIAVHDDTADVNFDSSKSSVTDVSYFNAKR